MAKALSVKQFNEYFKTSINHDPILTRVYIKGSLANIRKNSSHLYFSLKEDRDIVDCVIYYFEEKDIDFDFKEGMDVLVKGNLSYNNYSSKVVIIANDLSSVGLSEKYIEFLKIKEEFKKKGYFDQENKKPIRKLAKNIGLITSKDGAAVVDFLSIINQKPNNISIKLAAVKVQGSQAVPAIIEAIDYLDRQNLDVIVITRGGGSSEDLSVFNDKDLIEKVFLAKTPIISAIGHKIDTSLLDLVSDISLQTPTEAGSYIIADYADISTDSQKVMARMREILENQVRISSLRLKLIEKSINAYKPESIIEDKEKAIDKLKLRLDKEIKNNLTYNYTRLAVIENRLSLVEKIIKLKKSTISILDNNDREIYSKYSVKNGDEIQICFSDGRVRTIVIDG